MNDLRKQMQAMADQWARMRHPSLCERFVLRNGKEYAGRKLPTLYRCGEAKQCFMNATHGVWDHPNLTYVEGYAMRTDMAFPFLHAWCVNRQGGVVELTLKEPEKIQYVGVKLTREELRKELLKNGVYGVMDTGMINHEWMFKRDPGLREVVEEIIGRKVA